MNIREYQNSDGKIIQAIIQKLHPKWFDANAVRNIPIDINFNKTFVAEFDQVVKGFLVCSSKESKLTIDWLGVDLDMHNKGLGKALVDHLISYAKPLGVKIIEVETVVEQTPADGSYDLTIGFYQHIGFVVSSQSKLRELDGFHYRMGVFRKEI